MDNDRLEHFVEKGIEFGYPPCCILNFLHRVDAVDTGANQCLTKEQRIIANNGYGFVPCPSHAAFIVQKKISVYDLIVNRTHSKPFPHGH